MRSGPVEGNLIADPARITHSQYKRETRFLRCKQNEELPRSSFNPWTVRYLTAARTHGFFRFGWAAGRHLGYLGLGRADIQALAQLAVHLAKYVPVFLEEGAGI